MTHDINKMDITFQTAMELAPDEVQAIGADHANRLPADPTIEEANASAASFMSDLGDLIRRKRS